MLTSHGQAAALSTSYVWVFSALQLRMLPVTQTTGEHPSSARAEGEQGSLRRNGRGSPLTSWSFWNPKANSKDRAHREILGVLRRGYPEFREADSSEPGPSKIKPVVSRRRKLMWKFHFIGWTPSVCGGLGALHVWVVPPDFSSKDTCSPSRDSPSCVFGRERLKSKFRDEFGTFPLNGTDSRLVKMRACRPELF